MAKWNATKSAQWVIDAAVQLLGGLGVKRGHPVESLYREIRALRIYEGASEVQQLIIGRELLKSFAAPGGRAWPLAAHVDTFARDHLPAAADQAPEMLFELPELQYPERLNCASRPASTAPSSSPSWATASPCVRPRSPGTYTDLLDKASRIAHVLTREMGLVPGNRVLLHGFNNPMTGACWFGILKAGGIAVATMPLLRAGELKKVIAKARISHALCDRRLWGDLEQALPPDCPTLQTIVLCERGRRRGLSRGRADRNTPPSRSPTSTPRRTTSA